MKNTKGSVLVFALIILSFILVASFSLASVSLIERRSADVSVNSATAFQNSDKGTEEFLQQLYKDLDQNNDLDDLADALNAIYGSNIYSCEDGGTSHPARIGDQDTEFIITAYREKVAGPTNPDPTSGGWNSVDTIDDCGTSLADVSRFRTTGNYNNAARAVFLKLRDSLTRGLVAHWSFEDRANIARITPNAENRISYLAQDYSKYGHTLTLCNIDHSDPLTIEVVQVDGTVDDDMNIVDFSDCSFGNAGTGMSPFRGYGDTGDDEYNVNGAWQEGVVEETITVNPTAMGDSSSDEALYFDGSTYLATNFQSNCGAKEINCVSDTDDKLSLDDGIAVSLWVKTDASNASGYLVSKYDNNDGYEVYLNSGAVCFRLNNDYVCANNLKLDDDWHHVVVRWRKSDDKMEAFVDGKQTNLHKSYILSINNTSGSKIVIGAQSDPIGNYFTGMIDDVRIWNRALTETEICRLCNDAEMSGNKTSCDATACPNL